VNSYEDKVGAFVQDSEFFRKEGDRILAALSQ
jgi:hypothetical protein